MANNRDKTIQTRVSEEEYNIIDAKAKKLGISASNYIRMVCLHARIDISIQPQEDK